MLDLPTAVSPSSTCGPSQPGTTIAGQWRSARNVSASSHVHRTCHDEHRQARVPIQDVFVTQRRCHHRHHSLPPPHTYQLEGLALRHGAGSCGLRGRSRPHRGTCAEHSPHTRLQHTLLARVTSAPARTAGNALVGCECSCRHLAHDGSTARWRRAESHLTGSDQWHECSCLGDSTNEYAHSTVYSDGNRRIGATTCANQPCHSLCV